MISVVYRFFRPGSYFHARDNRLTVTSSSCQTFSKHLFWTGRDASGLISGKLPSDICCLSFFRPDPNFNARDNRLTVTSSSRQTFSKHLFWTGSDARGLISGKLPSNICCLSFFSSRILFSRRDNRLTVTSSSRQTFSKHLF